MKTHPHLSMLIRCLFLIASMAVTLPAAEKEESSVMPTGVPREWLVQKVATHDKVTAPLSKRFGWSEDAIKDLQRYAKPGDEIWFFDNTLLAKKMGRIGFALVREGKPIYHVLTLMS